MKQPIKILSVDKTDRYEGFIDFEINRASYSCFYFGFDFDKGQTVDVEFDHLPSTFNWDEVFNKNNLKELKLAKLNNTKCGYIGFGRIENINPVWATFGDIQLELGNWTNDPKVIGQYIYWKIHRLEVNNLKE